MEKLITRGLSRKRKKKLRGNIYIVSGFNETEIITIETSERKKIILKKFQKRKKKNNFKKQKKAKKKN